jgi:cellobiose-specific phosphotransferase system component IIA
MDRDKSARAEVLMAEGYEAMALAHRYRAKALAEETESRKAEADVLYAQAEGLFDDAEEDFRKAFEVHAVKVARYSVDGSKMVGLLTDILDQALELQHTFTETSLRAVVDRLQIIVNKCKEGLGDER